MSKVTEVCNHPDVEAESNTRLSGILVSDNTHANEPKHVQSHQQDNDDKHEAASSSHNEHKDDESQDKKNVHAASIPKPIHTLPADLSPSHKDVEDSNEESSSSHVFQASAGFILIATAFGFLVHA